MKEETVYVLVNIHYSTRVSPLFERKKDAEFYRRLMASQKLYRIARVRITEVSHAK